METVLSALAGVLGDGRGLDPGQEAPGRSTATGSTSWARSATSTRRSTPTSIVTHEVEGRDLTEAAIRRAIELSATKYCPVSAMVSAGATTVHHRYKIRSEGTVDYAIEGEVLSTGPYRRPDVMA